MDTNNWRPTSQGVEPVMDTGDWRNHLQPDSRQRIVNKITDTLKRHLPFPGQEGLNELKKIAGRFEEKIYIAATSQSDYLRKISLKMLSMESKSQNPMPNSLPPNNAGNSNKPPDQANQPQPHQQLLSQNIQNNMTSNRVPGSSGLPSALPSVSGLSQAPIPSVVNQNSTMQNISGASQNSVSSMGQGVPSNLFANSQRQMQGRQQVFPPQQQQQSQNPQQYMYQQQWQQQFLKQKLQHGNFSHTVMQPHMQQQQQQQQTNILQPNQLQSGMQSSSVMQPSLIQSAPLSSLQQNQQSSVQQQPEQQPNLLQPNQLQSSQPSGVQSSSVMLSEAAFTKPAAPVTLPSMMPSQKQQQQLMGQLSKAANMLQNQLIGQQNSVGDIEQQLHQRLLGQPSNLPKLQQQQQQINHALIFCVFFISALLWFLYLV